jgi:beta-glucosidase
MNLPSPGEALDDADMTALRESDLSRLARVQVGVATSSFQTEGALDLPGFAKSNWSEWQTLGRVERIGAACSLWSRFDRVIDRLATLEATVFRGSFEWARLWPDGPSVDEDAARGYADRVAMLRRAGVEPIVTLQHFTHPAWLGPDLWLDPRSPELFAEYVVSAARAVQSSLVARGARPITRWVTINEPNMLALASYGAGVFPHVKPALLEGSPLGAARALLALDHLATAHVRAYDALHALHESHGWPRPDVTYNPNLVDSYTLSAQWIDAMRTNARSARERASFIRARRSHFEGTFLEPEGTHSPRADVARAIDRALAGPLALDAFESLSRALSARGAKPAIDSRAFDLYDPWTRHQARGAEHALDAIARGDLGEALSLAGQSRVAIAEPWEWACEPATLERALLALHDPADPVPLDVLENGMSVERTPGAAARERPDRVRRPHFIRGYTLSFARAVCVLGLPARTYAHWTLVDNYELGRWSPRFGVFALGDPDDGASATADAPWSDRDALGDDAASALAHFAGACRDPERARAWVNGDANPER